MATANAASAPLRSLLSRLTIKGPERGAPEVLSAACSELRGASSAAASAAGADAASPSPPPPPPACKVCMKVDVVLPGPGVYSGYAPLTQNQCTQLGMYLNDGACGPTVGILSDFSCTAGPVTTTLDGKTVSEMEVCAVGDSAATSSFLAASDDVCANKVVTFLGYETCDVYVTTTDSCSSSMTYGTGCQNPDVDFPHSCFPGNSAYNGGRGQAPSAVRGTPYKLDDVQLTNHTVTFTITHQPQSCDAAASTPMKSNPPSNCCQMSLEKMEIVINKDCSNQVESLSVNGNNVATSYGTNTYPSKTYPVSQEASYRVFKVTKLDVTGDVKVSFTMRPGACQDPKVFLPNGELWFAYFNGNAFRNNCCGTSKVSV